MGRKNGEHEVKEIDRTAFWDGVVDFNMRKRVIAILQAEKDCSTREGWVAVAEAEDANDGEDLAGEATPVTTESSNCPGAMSSDSTSRIEEGDEREGAEGRNLEEKHSFAWCPCCRRMRVAISPNGSPAFSTIIVVYCGKCTRETDGVEKETRINKKKKNQGRGSEGFVGDEWGLQCKGLNISPEVWRGSEAAEIAKTIVGKEVDFLTDGRGGTAYLEATELWREVEKGVRIGSIDVEGFRTGKRKDLVLPYLEGGFL